MALWVISTIVYWGYRGIMEQKMETTIVHRGYIGMLFRTTSKVSRIHGLERSKHSDRKEQLHLYDTAIMPSTKRDLPQVRALTEHRRRNFE